MKVKRFNVELPLEEAVLLAQYFKKCYQAAPKFQLQEDKKIKKDNTRVAETPKYSDFNSDDALMKALERSYGKKD